MGILDDLIPRPTAPPATRTLKRRAVTSSQTTTEEITITIAPDNTCGYISERLGASRACPLNDCTDSESPYCNTVSWEGSTFDYWCNDLDISTAQSAALTYKGQTSREFGTINERDHSSLLSQMTEAKTEGSVNVEATGTATSQSAATETNKDSGSSGTPVSATAGGTVGGVAGLAIIGVAVFFFLCRKKKSKASSSSKYQQAPGGDKPGWNQQQQQGGYYYDPNSPSTGYNGSPNGQYGYQQAGGYPAGHQQPAIHEAGGEAVGSIPQELPDSGRGKKKPVELA
ncbi:hypothetical protein AU210_008326 [Fusarium oxysporum f. sp. radicis-cucumerinum]|uniref:Uncharacterized protein n=1 Tax=Fusarium oxysporum f. sp. radicis-cucumerinum TaxID=327505 RepID=A0A2H3GZ02_FUSOX|nr:hypothetical protein AU210_008326 [Fusarium oxysporum f. sp. radicis-cucumerinum]